MRTIFAIAFLAAIVGFAVSLALGLGDPKGRTLAEKFPLKEQFIELNGGASRLAGRRFVNEVYRTPRGMLLMEMKNSPEKLEKLADVVAYFADWLAKRNIPYVYAQAPTKIDMEGRMLPPPLVNTGNEKADIFLAAAKERGVHTIDLRRMLTATEDDVMRYFYFTDHHWNNDAVFRVFRHLAPELVSAAGEDPAKAATFLAPASWRRKVWRKCFMGTRAWRTGRFFGGVLDDAVAYTPRFKTKMTMTVPSRRIRHSGNFRNTVMWRSRTMQTIPENGVRKDGYLSLYIGGMYDVVRHENRGAPVGKRLLIVGDSYVRPLQAMLSSIFTDILVLDQRRFSEGMSVAGFVEEFKPDLVLQLNNPSALGISRDFADMRTSSSPPLFNYGDLK